MTTPQRRPDAGEPGIGGLQRFLDDSPSPWHVVGTAADALRRAAFVDSSTEPGAAWSGAGFVVRDAALVAWRTPNHGAPGPFRIVGAHTDSPCLRIKPQPDVEVLGWRQLGVEIYGGALLNSWLDRDLGIAGRVVTSSGHRDLLVRDALCRVPQLAIHLDRDINERGLVLDKHTHLTPVWGTGTGTLFDAWLADHCGVTPGDVLAWDLSLFDLAPSAVLGADRSLLASGRLDNQVSCWAAVQALIDSAPADTTAVVALFDHEEVGSASTTGAAGPLLEHVLERLVLAGGGDRTRFLDALAGSRCISADNAHAVHPNYPERHDPLHRPLVNHGPAVKVNANQRYATTAATTGWLTQVFGAAGIPWQTFASRNNMPCGSTIGPITATRLGIDTVDVGVPQLSMHSARELCGVEDPVYLRRALTAFFGSA